MVSGTHYFVIKVFGKFGQNLHGFQQLVRIDSCFCLGHVVICEDTRAGNVFMY